MAHPRYVHNWIKNIWRTVHGIPMLPVAVPMYWYGSSFATYNSLLTWLAETSVQISDRQYPLIDCFSSLEETEPSDTFRPIYDGEDDVQLIHSRKLFDIGHFVARVYRPRANAVDAARLTCIPSALLRTYLQQFSLSINQSPREWVRCSNTFKSIKLCQLRYIHPTLSVSGSYIIVVGRRVDHSHLHPVPSHCFS
jgi:hypothetical protein